MPKGYWIARVDVSDPEQYKRYVAANAESLRKYGAHFLFRAGRSETPEGISVPQRGPGWHRSGGQSAQRSVSDVSRLAEALGRCQHER